MAESAVVALPNSGAATLIATGGESAETSVLVKITGAATAYFGGSTVTSATGYPLAAAGTTAIQLASNEKLYACTASATSEASVLITSKGSIFDND